MDATLKYTKMKKPNSKLPWRLVETEEDMGQSYIVVNGELNGYDEPLCILNDQSYYPEAPEKEDAEYIVEACNNYPKAIELLKTWSELSKMYGSEYTVKAGEKLLKEGENFLKSIEK